MYFFNKTIFVNNLSNIHSVFTKNYIIQKTWIPTSICSEKIAIKHYKDESDPEYMIRIWRTNTIFDYWYNGFTCGNFIASLYYTKNEDSIKITYLALNDSSYRSFDKNSNRINNKDSDAEFKFIFPMFRAYFCVCLYFWVVGINVFIWNKNKMKIKKKRNKKWVNNKKMMKLQILSKI